MAAAAKANAPPRVRSDTILAPKPEPTEAELAAMASSVDGAQAEADERDSFDDDRIDQVDYII